MRIRYIIIAYIAIGLVLSMVIGFEHGCDCEELLPTYYASPFIFKQNSLGASMEYFYSISGLALNSIIWGVCLFFIDRLIKVKNRGKAFKNIYYVVVVLLILYSSYNIIASILTLGSGFGEGQNYWYWGNEFRLWS